MSLEELCYDFNSQDVSNIIYLEHINLAEPDQMTSMVFYVEGLGLTRDPYAPENSATMWINIGDSQIHVAKYDIPQVLAGHIGLVTPSISLIIQRLKNIENHKLMKDTKFSWKIKDSFKKDLVPKEYSGKVIHVTCPWGNKFRIYEHSIQFGAHQLAIYYVLHHCSLNTSHSIAQFYQKYFQAPVTLVPAQKMAHVTVGPNQRLIFLEQDNFRNENYTNYHIAIYLSDYSQTYHRFSADKLLFIQHRFNDKCDTLEDALKWKQFRTKEIINEHKEVILSFEHEVRSLHHHYFRRPLINRFGNTGIYCSQ